MTEEFRVRTRSGFDPHDPEIEQMMRGRALEQGREHHAALITRDLRALDPDYEGEIRQLAPLAEVAPGLESWDASFAQVYAAQMAPICRESVQSGFYLEPAAADAVVQTFQISWNGPQRDLSDLSIKVLMDACEPPERAAQRQRHGYASVCPRHGQVCGGLCRHCTHWGSEPESRRTGGGRRRRGRRRMR